jgi:hypothetical protein
MLRMRTKLKGSAKQAQNKWHLSCRMGELSIIKWRRRKHLVDHFNRCAICARFLYQRRARANRGSPSALFLLLTTYIPLNFVHVILRWAACARCSRLPIYTKYNIHWRLSQPRRISDCAASRLSMHAWRRGVNWVRANANGEILLVIAQRGRSLFIFYTQMHTCACTCSLINQMQIALGDYRLFLT